MELEIKRLTDKEQERIERERENIFKKLENIPEEGVEVAYLDKTFRVLKGVFWPHDDSKEIVNNMVIHPTDEVLDVCTGSGVIAVFAALKGARKVVALDINPKAIETVNINAKRFNVENVTEGRVSDVFSALKQNEKFDVITCNPPFSDRKVKDENRKFIEQTIKDTNLVVHKKLFEGFQKHLKPTGRIYISQSNFGNIDDMLNLATSSGFKYKLIGKRELENDPRAFYAFELIKSS
ncbi:MAG: methyltransferase [Candidatus Nomurabacteria bacterium]|nr:methyltransferase [Candidatus Nomurabacteria bacterium]